MEQYSHHAYDTAPYSLFSYNYNCYEITTLRHGTKRIFVHLSTFRRTYIGGAPYVLPWYLFVFFNFAIYHIHVFFSLYFFHFSTLVVVLVSSSSSSSSRVERRSDGRTSWDNNNNNGRPSTDYHRRDSLAGNFYHHHLRFRRGIAFRKKVKYFYLLRRISV